MNAFDLDDVKVVFTKNARQCQFHRIGRVVEHRQRRLSHHAANHFRQAVGGIPFDGDHVFVRLFKIGQRLFMVNKGQQ